MNCLNFVKVGKVKVAKGSETFFMVCVCVFHGLRFIDKIMHQKTHFHKFRDNLSAIVRFDHLQFR